MEKVKKLSAEEYRQKFGFSRTRKRLLQKNDLSLDMGGIATYNASRKAVRDAQKKESKAKADRAKAGRKLKVKK